MTHEFKKIVQAYQRTIAQRQVKAVLATVVALEGSSYRRPGVRMLIFSDGSMAGAVSGGCVEKEVNRQAHSVFEDGIPKIMTYDGRYRLGCEGILYILLEPFEPSESVLETFWATLTARRPFVIKSHFQQKEGSDPQLGSVLEIGGEPLHLRGDGPVISDRALIFEQPMSPCFRLVLIGAEHDAVQLCSMATFLGWEVTVVVDPKEEKTLADFPGAVNMDASDDTTFAPQVDDQTAIILMTHSYAKDLRYLMALGHLPSPRYLGVLGPVRRREKLLNELLEHLPDIPLEFVESIFGPAGLDLGAETPQEIALAILAEIVATVNGKDGVPLREKLGRIHQ